MSCCGVPSKLTPFGGGLTPTIIAAAVWNALLASFNAPATFGNAINAILASGGAFTNLALANPAAGANFTTTVPVGETWIVMSVSGLLTTSAAVANRIAILTLNNAAAAVIGNSLTPAAQTATQAVRYTYSATFGQPVSGGANLEAAFTTVARLLPLRTAAVPAGGSVASTVTALAAGDQWSDVVITYLRTT